MHPAGSRWTRIRRPSQYRSDEPRAALFVFCRRRKPLQDDGNLAGAMFLFCAYVNWWHLSENTGVR